MKSASVSLGMPTSRPDSSQLITPRPVENEPFRSVSVAQLTNRDAPPAGHQPILRMQSIMQHQPASYVAGGRPSAEPQRVTPMRMDGATPRPRWGHREGGAAFGGLSIPTFTHGQAVTVGGFSASTTSLHSVSARPGPYGLDGGLHGPQQTMPALQPPQYGGFSPVGAFGRPGPAMVPRTARGAPQRPMAASQSSAAFGFFGAAPTRPLVARGGAH